MEVYFELNYDDENDDDDDDEGDIEKVKRLFQVPNIVRRLADADNLPCRIGNYFHHDYDNDNDENCDDFEYILDRIAFHLEIPFCQIRLFQVSSAMYPSPPGTWSRFTPGKTYFCR